MEVRPELPRRFRRPRHIPTHRMGSSAIFADSLDGLVSNHIGVRDIGLSLMKREQFNIKKRRALVFLICLSVFPPASSLANTNKVIFTKVRIKGIIKGISKFKDDTGRYQSNDEGLFVLSIAPENTPGWKGPYIGSPYLAFDSWGSGFVYRFPSQRPNRDYDIYSIGPNKIDENGLGDDVSTDLK